MWVLQAVGRVRVGGWVSSWVLWWVLGTRVGPWVCVVEEVACGVSSAFKHVKINYRVALVQHSTTRCHDLFLTHGFVSGVYQVLCRWGDQHLQVEHLLAHQQMSFAWNY